MKLNKLKLLSVLGITVFGAAAIAAPISVMQNIDSYTNTDSQVDTGPVNLGRATISMESVGTPSRNMQYRFNYNESNA